MQQGKTETTDHTHRKRISRHRPDNEYDYADDGDGDEEREENNKYSSSFNYISVRPACRASRSLTWLHEIISHTLSPARTRTPLYEPVI